MQGAKKEAQESPQVPVRERAELGSIQQAPGNVHCCKGGGQHAPRVQPEQSLPTLCRYETTGGTSTGRRDLKSGPVSVPNQRGQQATGQWCGIPRLNYSLSDVPPTGGRLERKRVHQTVPLPGREGPPHSSNETC